MALYIDEEEVWKCPKHPSKRRRSGICPICLRERLGSLCPDCANVRPCACCPTSSSSSSSSSSFSLFSSRGGSSNSGVGDVGKVSKLIDSEPSFRRSRSLAIPFLRSRSRFAGDFVSGEGKNSPPGSRNRASSFWSVFKANKSKRSEEEEDKENSEMKSSEVVIDNEYERARMMMRSRSVAVPVTSGFGSGDFRSSSRTTGKGWHFPSPMKVFRHSKVSKVVQERSPLYRG
ncbi:unnamed protein product [Ilex paraguariensis]|uniref:Uncharacterized protein n=1 Tax=Ilex paraguariensis TaxID=185542 RepID=A0ABC8RDS0_9AQUA